MRPKPMLAALAALAALAFVVWQVAQSVRRTFAPPVGVAQVARASPRTQNGLTLLEIDNVSPDRGYQYTDKGPQDIGGSSAYSVTDTGLWIEMPPNFSAPPNCGQSNYIGCDKALSVTARTSTGRTFALAWQMSSGSISSGESNPTYLLAPIPAGYPNTVHWVDVTVDDKRGDAATWRITHLPPTQHIIAPPVTPQPTFHQGNIQVAASAHGGVDPNNPSLTPGLRFDLKGTIAGSAHQWEIGHLTQTLEWEPPGYVPQDAGLTMGTEKIGNKVNIDTQEQQLFFNRSMPYLADTHWVRLSATWQEFETYDEIVTFHNVSVFKPKNGGQYSGRYIVGPGPQTVISPSGITVTLDDVQHQQHPMGISTGNDYSLHLLYPQSAVFSSLPHSPFWRKYKRLITVSADIPKPYEPYGSSTGGSEGTYSFRSDKPLPKVIANFPVIIRQRVDLRAVPMTFTLPVQGKAPKRAGF